MTISVPGRRWSAVVACAVAGCATEGIVADQPKTATAFAIAPYEVHEECARVVAGDRLDYRFEATSPVSFQIFYQEGITFIAPVSRDDVNEYSGIFLVPEARHYCLRWEAGQQGALLDYRIRLLPASNTP